MEIKKQLEILNQKISHKKAIRDDLVKKQKFSELELSSVEDRIKTLESRLYSPASNSTKNLQAMEKEVSQLRHRVSDLSDPILELMENIEQVDVEISPMTSQQEQLLEMSQHLQTEIDKSEQQINEHIDQLHEKRDELVALINPSLVTTYESLRKRLGGIGVARLVHGTCEGCRISFSRNELDRLHRMEPPAIDHCEQCGRLLVIGIDK